LVFLLHVCSAEASKKAQQSYAHAREARNKYDLTTSPFNHNDWSRWFAISSSHVYAVAVPVSWVGLKRRKYLDVRNMFSGVTY
jgi:hypothetical protein